MISHQLLTLIPTAMKAHDELTLSVLRMLSSALNYEKIDKQHDLSEEEELAVAKKEAKKRRDSIEAYDQGGREDLVQREKAELAVLQQFLPPDVTDEAIATIVDEAIKVTGASSVSDFGKVMKEALGQLKGAADGAKVATMVKARLGA